MSSAKKAVIFDLDGTLLDTLQDLCDSGNAVLEAHGHAKHSKEDYKTFIGDGMMNLVRAIFPEGHKPESDEECDTLLAEYREAYGRNWTNTTVPFPGIPELLTALVEREIPIGVLSNKGHDFTVKCVEEFLSDWNWTEVFGHRDGFEKKPHPSGAIEVAAKMGIAPADCCYVGDSDVDIFTAKNAGMYAVGVSWGFRSVEELRNAGADVILKKPAELLDLF